MHIHAQFFPQCSALCFNSRQWGWGGEPACSLAGSPRNTDAVNMHRLARLICLFFCSLSHLQLRPESQILTFSVSRSFTVGNGVLVDILCVSQAAVRCSGRSGAERSRHGAVRSGGASLHPLVTTPRAAALHHSIARTRQVSRTSFV